MSSRTFLFLFGLSAMGGCAEVSTAPSGDTCDQATCAGVCVDGFCEDLCDGVACDDDNDCTSDECNPLTGTCQFSNLVDDATCDFEGLPGLCKAGECVDAELCADVDCDDGDLCTQDSCDPGTGACSNVPLDCDDDDACTTDSCNPSVGCQHIEKVCGDGNVCTADSCEDGECMSTDVANGTNCDSTSHCTGGGGVICIPIGGSCLFGSCIVCGSNGSCSDLNPCTADTCTSGRCSYSNRPDGTACSISGNPGQCLFGRCFTNVIVTP